MAQDKIYCEKCSDGMYSHTDIWDGGDNVAYIRKDALLEWARERLDFACALKSEGQKTVCKEFIDKIESL